ncbi:MAG: response regulator [Anaerolineae bacterium]|nr:response regulator [Anaerolineae bacterium]
MVEPTDAHILVIEDNIYNYTLIAKLLKFLGVKSVDWSRTGRQIQGLGSSLPRVDLILLDIHLPYEDGYTTLERLRSNERFEGTRVLAVTAEATEDNMRRAREAGFDGFIAKPIDPDHFPDQVVMALQGESVWDLGRSMADN